MSAKHAEIIKKSTSLRTSARSFTPSLCPHLTKPPSPVSADVLYGRPLIHLMQKSEKDKFQQKLIRLATTLYTIIIFIWLKTWQNASIVLTDNHKLLLKWHWTVRQPRRAPITLYIFNKRRRLANEGLVNLIGDTVRELGSPLPRACVLPIILR